MKYNNLVVITSIIVVTLILTTTITNGPLNALQLQNANAQISIRPHAPLPNIRHRPSAARWCGSSRLRPRPLPWPRCW